MQVLSMSGEIIEPVSAFRRALANNNFKAVNPITLGAAVYADITEARQLSRKVGSGKVKKSALEFYSEQGNAHQRNVATRALRRISKGDY